MSQHVKITYDKAACIGHAACEAVCPKHFVMDHAKAELIDGKEVDTNLFESVVQPENEEHAQSMKEAEQVCPVNAIVVKTCDADGTITEVEKKQEPAREVLAQYDDRAEFVIDPAGYFLIRIDREKQLIEVAFCNEKNVQSLIVRGAKPIDIYHTIAVKEKLQLRPEHYSYLGRELQKAYIALQKNVEYVQDDELNL